VSPWAKRPYRRAGSSTGSGLIRFGTGSNCEPDEARGSQLCPAHSLYVEPRGRPSNVAVAYRSRESEASGEMAREIWRSKLAQYPVPIPRARNAAVRQNGQMPKGPPAVRNGA